MLALALTLALVAPQHGQQPEKLDAAQPAPESPLERLRRPFRYARPTKTPKLPKEIERLVSDTHTLRLNYESASEHGFDEEGRPWTKHEFFKKLRATLTERLSRKGGHLAWVLREDASSAHRRECYLAALLLPERQDTLHIMRYLPYEPSTPVRHEAIRMAMPFLEKHLGSKTAKGYRYTFDGLVWIDASRAPATTDRVLALGVLTTLAKARPEAGPDVLRLMKRWMPDNLKSKNAELRKAARTLIETVEPEAKLPAAGDEAVAYFGRVLRKLFPDIRLHGGSCDLYPGPDLDKLVAVGEPMLRRAQLGTPERIKVNRSFGTTWVSGLRIKALPAPLDRLGLAEGVVLTSVNGVALEKNADLLHAIEAVLASKTTQKAFVVEWVDKKGKTRARRYALKKRDDS